LQKSGNNLFGYFKNIYLVNDRPTRKLSPNVTRLGDFLPVGRMFILGSFFKIAEVAQIFKVPFSTE
jgi:hypothetical protein